MPELQDSAARIQTQVQVMFYDTDCAGVVHNIAYLRFIEEARTRLAEQLGMPLATMGEEGRYPVVVRTEIDYRKPAKLGDELLINGWLDEIASARFWCGFEIVRKSNNDLCVTSRQTLAIVEMPQGRPIRLPANWSTLAKSQAR